MSETVPADIAAAIEELVQVADAEVWHMSGVCGDAYDAKLKSARLALDAAILAHLRKADELKAALERITSGGA